MASTHATAHISFRIFTLPDTKPGGSGVAIGRNHASWFLVLARPEGIRKVRVIHCLNTIIPDDPSSVGALSSAGRHCFAVGGQVGPKILKELASMRDCEGRAAFEILENYPDDHPLGLCALVEVQVPDEELMYACARCGRWETQRGPRFLRCSGCKSRFYCSAQCQKEDWKPDYHRGECDLLKQGKHYEVENRRKLHDNGWWFHNGAFGDKALMESTGEYEYECAETTGDWDYIAYGRRVPPHDVPPSAGTRPALTKEYVSSLPPDAVPPGFISTGDADGDRRLIERFRATVLETDGSLPPFLNPMRTPGLASNGVPARAIPAFPALPVPQAEGFVFMGDPRMDEDRLGAFLEVHGTEAERKAFARVVRARDRCIDERERLRDGKEERSREYKQLVTDHLLAVQHNWRELDRVAGWGIHGAAEDEDDDDDDEAEEAALEEVMARLVLEAPVVVGEVRTERHKEGSSGEDDDDESGDDDESEDEDEEGEERKVEEKV